MNATVGLEQFAPDTFRFYRRALELLRAAEVPFLIGGAYAFGSYTGVTRHTKDLDLFIPRAKVEQALAAFAAAGYRGEVVFAHWLAKAYHADDFVDLIYGSGNGQCPVTDDWFEHAPAAQVLGVDVRLVPAEEMIWQKAYIMERERFDGADVNHLLRARGGQLDWDRLLARFGAHGRVLLGHLIFFGFVYPADRASVPPRVVQALLTRLRDEPATAEPVCQGPLVSRTQYLADVEEWGYADPRLEPAGPMTREEVQRWTDAGR